MRRIAFIPILLLWTSGPATAAGQNLCAADLHRLLRVTSTFSAIQRSPSAPGPSQDVFEDFVVSRSGVVVGQAVHDELCDNCTTHNTVVAGQASMQDLNSLRQVIDSNHIGIQTSCFQANLEEGTVGPRLFGTFELTWYGRNGRKNTWSVIYDNADHEGILPPCSPSVQTIVNTVRSFFSGVASRPGPAGCNL